jgi:quercetin dioxygenase-like cupin family protein
MNERIFKVLAMLPRKGTTFRELIYTDNHEIHFWRIQPGEWIYPHTHPHSDDIWYIIQGAGEYYTGADETRRFKAGDIGIAKPGEVHGVYNSGPEDILILSVLAPLPIEIEEVPGFNYPE